MQTRILDIYARYSEYIHRLVPLQVEDEYLKIVIYFADGSNLRVAEEWDGDMLVGYSYYWLTPDNQLKIGWDNAPHHAKLENLPHHKQWGSRPTGNPLTRPAWKR
jgi:hypothetical protein